MFISGVSGIIYIRVRNSQDGIVVSIDSSCSWNFQDVSRISEKTIKKTHRSFSKLTWNVAECFNPRFAPWNTAHARDRLFVPCLWTTRSRPSGLGQSLYFFRGGFASRDRASPFSHPFVKSSFTVATDRLTTQPNREGGTPCEGERRDYLLAR